MPHILRVRAAGGPRPAAALLAAAAAAAVAPAAASAGPSSTAVTSLAPGDWERWGKVWARSPMAVNFFAQPDLKLELGEGGKAFAAPRCELCPHFAPLWENVSTFAAADGVGTGAVDCTEQRQFCKAQKVDRYPTVILYGEEAKRLREYDGRLVLVDILEWLEEHTGRPLASSLPRMMRLRAVGTRWGTWLVSLAESLVGKESRVLVGLVMMLFMLGPTFLGVMCCLQGCLWCLVCLTRSQARRQQLRAAQAQREEKKQE